MHKHSGQREKAWRQYGYLKNVSPAFVLLLNKDKTLKTFLKAHIAPNPCKQPCGLSRTETIY